MLADFIPILIGRGLPHAHHDVIVRSSSNDITTFETDNATYNLRRATFSKFSILESGLESETFRQIFRILHVARASSSLILRQIRATTTNVRRSDVYPSCSDNNKGCDINAERERRSRTHAHRGDGGGGRGEGELLWPTKNVIKYKRKGGISCKVIINVGACDGELPPQTFGNTRISHIPFTVRSSTLTLGKGCSIPGRSSILISHWHRFSLCQKSGYRSSIHPFSPPLIKRNSPRFSFLIFSIKFIDEKLPSRWNIRDEEDLDRSRRDRVGDASRRR